MQVGRETHGPLSIDCNRREKPGENSEVFLVSAGGERGDVGRSHGLPAQVLARCQGHLVDGARFGEPYRRRERIVRFVGSGSLSRRTASPPRGVRYSAVLCEYTKHSHPAVPSPPATLGFAAPGTDVGTTASSSEQPLLKRRLLVQALRPRTFGKAGCGKSAC